MAGVETAPEKFNRYQVELSPELQGLRFKEVSQLAYAVNPENFKL